MKPWTSSRNRQRLACIISEQSISYDSLCEEILSNVIRETSDDVLSGQEITLWISTYALHLESPPAFAIKIEDDGPHYDPDLGIERQVDVGVPISERKPGGLGLYLVQQSVDIAEYYYAANRNTYCLAVAM